MISFQDVNKHYGHFHVLKNINLHIKKGEVVVIIGPQDREKARFSAASISWKQLMKAR